MKILIITICLTFASSLSALELLVRTDSKTVKKIDVSELQGVHVNSECLREKNHCLKILSQEKKVLPKKRTDQTIGNPASDFCHSAVGSSIILEDKKHSEYDYCLLEDKYFVDSWDFFKKYKK